jgi:predicted RNA methylase
MTTKVVGSENPLEHWNDIQDIENKVVLDLGCGWLFQPFQSTPEYFMSRGAKKIIGVDASCGEIEKLKQTYPDHSFVCKTILEFDDLVSLITEYKPQVIKMDIEGYEKHMENITSEQFESVEEIAVEYHNPACKQILEDKLNELGFEIFAINQFGWFCTDINQMGIMHAKRKI